MQANTEATIVPTPLGPSLLIACDDRGVCESRWVRWTVRLPRSSRLPLLAEACRQVTAYFSRRLRRFEVPLSLEGSAFTLSVWSAVARLESGCVVSYADVARAVGRPHAHRGVARALSLAPLSLFIPAHRVVGADGRIKGAGPRSMRRRLLRFEGIELP